MKHIKSFAVTLTLCVTCFIAGAFATSAKAQAFLFDYTILYSWDNSSFEAQTAFKASFQELLNLYVRQTGDGAGLIRMAHEAAQIPQPEPCPE